MQFQSEEEARRAKAEADLPPLPPLLAQILAETRAKQQAAKEGREYVPERKAGSDGNASDGEGQPPSGPLLLEGPSSGLVMQGTNVPDRQPGDSDSDSDAEPEAPLGPLDPARCRVHGPGFSGGAAGQPVKLTLTARDTNGKRIREGGAHVLVMVEPPRAPGAQEEPDAIEAEVTDHGDGTYTVVYTVPAKGNYQLHIEVDGEPVGDSPYPVFFSAAKLVTESGAGPAGGVAAAPGQPAAVAQPGQAQLPAPVTTAGGFQVVTAQSIKAAQAQSQTQLGAAAAAGDVGAGVALAAGFPAGAAPQSSLGADMVRSGIAFPPIDAEQLQRMVLVGGVMPLATPDALKSVFSHAGAIVNCQLVPPSFALVAFSSIAEAANALTIGGASLMGQPLRVELAVEAKQAADAALAAHNPYAALQAQQLAHFQMLQQQQAALAQQVATMRAAQRTGVQLPLDQRIVLKDKKEANGSERRRSRSRSRDRGGRRRSRSRERDGRSSRRSRSRERERGGRRRSRSRDRKRSHRSRSRERGSRHKEHKHKHHKRSRRSRSRDRKEDKSAGGEKAEGDAAAAAQQQAAAAAGGNKDDLEALLDEFEG